MKFKNKTNSYSLWIEEAKTMIVWGDKGIADVTDKRAIKYLQEHGYAPVMEQSVSSPKVSAVTNKK